MVLRNSSPGFLKVFHWLLFHSFSMQSLYLTENPNSSWGNGKLRCVTLNDGDHDNMTTTVTYKSSNQHPKKSLEFKKPGELFLKTTYRNHKKAWLRECRLCWRIQVITPNIDFIQTLFLPYMLYFYVCLHVLINILMQTIKKWGVAQDSYTAWYVNDKEHGEKLFHDLFANTMLLFLQQHSKWFVSRHRHIFPSHRVVLHSKTCFIQGYFYIIEEYCEMYMVYTLTHPDTQENCL